MSLENTLVSAAADPIGSLMADPIGSLMSRKRGLKVDEDSCATRLATIEATIATLTKEVEKLKTNDIPITIPPVLTFVRTFLPWKFYSFDIIDVNGKSESYKYDIGSNVMSGSTVIEHCVQNLKGGSRLANVKVIDTTTKNVITIC